MPPPTIAISRQSLTRGRKLLRCVAVGELVVWQCRSICVLSEGWMTCTGFVAGCTHIIILARLPFTFLSVRLQTRRANKAIAVSAC